jgi:hypothetical protein
MSDIHIDDFYKDAGMILVRLYASFPRKSTLYVEDICGPDTPDEFGLHSERFLSCFSTMVWLAEQGYLAFESTIRQEAIDQAMLTHKGFLLLSSRCALPADELKLSTTTDELAEGKIPPSVLDDLHTNIVQLRKALKSRSSIRIKKCMHYLLSNESNYR